MSDQQTQNYEIKILTVQIELDFEQTFNIAINMLIHRTELPLIRELIKEKYPAAKHLFLTYTELHKSDLIETVNKLQSTPPV